MVVSPMSRGDSGWDHVSLGGIAWRDGAEDLKEGAGVGECAEAAATGSLVAEGRDVWQACP